MQGRDGAPYPVLLAGGDMGVVVQRDVRMVGPGIIFLDEIRWHSTLFTIFPFLVPYEMHTHTVFISARPISFVLDYVRRYFSR